ncbi:MAG: hypothetical protein FWD03_05030 [Defluviitaleaceae bacterium]|nr:hypothetical protein [Defluviitaleaceae bacterium]
MSENLISLLSPKEQKLLKPAPETIAAEILSENMQNDVVELCDCIRTNNLRIKWVGKNGWEVAIRKMQILRRIRINPLEKNWYVTLHFFPQYNDYLTDKEIHNFVWNNLGGMGCDALNTGGTKCNGYMSKAFNIFGRMCENQCCNSQIKIMNPTGKALEYTKTLILTARDIATDI